MVCGRSAVYPCCDTAGDEKGNRRIPQWIQELVSVLAEAGICVPERSSVRFEWVVLTVTLVP
jgi:hypothetical protein